jgi:hypothetical protein
MRGRSVIAATAAKAAKGVTQAKSQLPPMAATASRAGHSISPGRMDRVVMVLLRIKDTLGTFAASINSPS